MKIMLVFAFVLFVGAATTAGLEREQESGGVEIASEHSTQTPVVSLQPKDKDQGETEVTSVNDDDGDASGPAKCSPQICHLKCRLNGCVHSQCLDDDRCSCYCPRIVDPFEQFFRSILTSHLEPGVSIRRRPTESASPFGFSHGFGIHHESGLFDLRKLFDQTASAGGVHAKVYRTMQQTCRQADDCASACTNCTQTQCDDNNFCRCSQCAREDVESRSTNVLHTCRSARNCAEHCKGCVVTTCRYGVCECRQCETTETATDSEPAASDADDLTTVAADAAVDGKSKEATTTPEEEEEASTVASTDDTMTTTTTGEADVESSTVAEILTVRTNETLSDAETARDQSGGRCVPKRCNHSCWERQCSKWNCVNDRCECDGCPEEVSVIVKNVEGKPEKLQEDNTKYEIIF